MLVVVIWTRGGAIFRNFGCDIKYLKIGILVNFKVRSASSKTRKYITRQAQ